MKTIKKVKLYELMMLIVNEMPPEKIIYNECVYTYNKKYQDYQYSGASNWLFKRIFANDTREPFNIIVEIIEEI